MSLSPVLKERIDSLVNSNRIVLFMKGTLRSRSADSLHVLSASSTTSLMTMKR